MEENEIRSKGLVLTALVLILFIFPPMLSSWNIYEPVREKRIKHQVSGYTEHVPISISSNNQFSENGFTGNGTPDNPYVLSNVRIVSNWIAIFVLETSAHFVIRDSLLEGNSAGIALGFSGNASIINCSIVGNSRGITISNSSDVSIIDCEVQKATVGIDLGESTGITMQGVTLHHNYDAIYFSGASNNSIQRSVVYSNRHSGIWVDSESTGNAFQNCSIGWNGAIHDGVVTSEVNAVDSGKENTWDSISWSDYDGTGAYVVGAESIVVNPRPFRDSTPPVVEGPEDLRYEEGEPLGSIRWNASDEFMSYVRIWVNNELFMQGDWIEESVTVQITNENVGSHNYTAEFFDAAGNRAVDEVRVLILLDVFSGQNLAFVFYASMASVVVVIVALVAIKKAA